MDIPANVKRVGIAGGDVTTHGGDPPAQAWPVRVDGANALVHNGTAAWEDSDAPLTAKNVDVPLPAPLHPGALYLISVYNPSAETDLLVVVQNKHESLGGGDRHDELTSFRVPKGGARDALVQGWLLGDGGRLQISNETVIGAAGAFTAAVRVRRV